MTDDEFFSHAQDADYWFFPSPDWNATQELFANRLEEIKAYREQEVYDYMGRGSNTWFEQRFAEFYLVVEDVCHTLDVKPSLTGRSFWRNVFTEGVPSSGADAECNEQTEGSILEDNDVCVRRTLSPTSATSTASATRAVLVGLALTIAAFFTSGN